MTAPLSDRQPAVWPIPVAPRQCPRTGVAARMTVARFPCYLRDMRVCEFCKQELPRGRKDMKFCSDVCRSRANRAARKQNASPPPVPEVPPQPGPPEITPTPSPPPPLPLVKIVENELQAERK